MRQANLAVGLAGLEQADSLAEDSSEIGSVDLVDDQYVRVAVRRGVCAKQVARADLEREATAGGTRIQANYEVLVRTSWMELHHLVRADRLADFQREPS